MAVGLRVLGLISNVASHLTVDNITDQTVLSELTIIDLNPTINAVWIGSEIIHQQLPHMINIT